MTTCPHCGMLNASTDHACSVCGRQLITSLQASGARQGTQLAVTQRISSATTALVVTRPGQQEFSLPLSNRPLVVGRAASCDLVLDFDGISQVHALVTEHDNAYTIRDQGSTNGIYVAGKRVDAAPLTATAPIALADPSGALVTLTACPLAPDSTIGTNAGPPLLDEARSFPLAQRHTALTLGRDPGNDIPIDLPLVSRRHACLEPQVGGAWALRDLKSTNGAYVNGQRVQGARLLQHNDEIAIGSARFHFEGSALVQYEVRPRVRLDAIDLVYQTKPGAQNVILHHVSLTVLPQEFVALIGGSGASKSTLLNALTGAVPAQTGAVLFNGDDYYRAPGPYRGLIGYVPQDDILHRDLPVERALDYVAQLRLPPDTTPAERAQRVTSVLASVKMEPHRHKVIARLSGGQRKRVSIAVELLAHPSILFLDEPTSGLDPGLDKTVMTLLADLCAKGHTVVLVTHTTENIGFCTQVAFLAGAGRLVYYGLPAEATTFFGVASFADIYRLFDGDPAEAERRAALFQASPQYAAYVAGRRRTSAQGAAPAGTAAPAPLTARQLRVAAWRQLTILTRRYAEVIWRDRVNLALLLAQTPVVAALLALVSSPDSFTQGQGFRTEQVLLMLALTAIWFGIINAAREIVKERSIYLRERTVCLRIWPYILSKFGVLALLSGVQSLALLWIVSLKTSHLPAQGIIFAASGEMYVTLALTSGAGIAGGLLISSLVSSADRAMSIVPVVLIGLVIFSGGVFDLSGAPGFVSLFAVSHWCLAALGSIANLNGVDVGCSLRRTIPTDFCRDMYGSPDALHLLFYWVILIVFTVTLLGATYWSLRRRDTRTA